jgi:Relaxase/Mobilisation nuclease domain
MIAKGNTHNSGARLASYMMTEKDGERVELVELRGFASEDVREAFRSVDAMALGTRSRKPMFHVAVRNPAGEHLTRQQWLQVADHIESKLGFDGQPRAIAFHISADGDTHLHIGFSRIDPETMKLKCPAFYKLRLKEACRELEARFGLTIVRSQRDGKPMSPHRHEFEQARRLGVDIKQTRAVIRECWERSDTGKSFQAALDGQGLRLVKGDRRA